jgi:hypothetical protein
MILYGSQRGRSAELAVHLLNGDQNEHVAVHEIRGFAADDLAGALEEAFAVSKGTRCSQFLFSLSLNPPETEEVPIEDFESAIHEVERKLGLSDQPRVIVFHEKNGRRHCHAVWSRIQAVGGKLCAINMDFYKRKLTELSRQFFIEHGWELPKGLQKAKDKDPMNLTREEYRQSVRLVEDPQALKAMFRRCWEQTDTRATFARALEEHGFFLARGDRRGYVAVDVKGGIYSLTRWLDVGTRDLKARIGATETLPSAEQAKGFITSRMTANLERFIEAAKAKAKEMRAPLVQEIRTMTAQHRKERAELLDKQQKRWVDETKQRSRRLARGVKGIWERITGDYQKIRTINEAETKAALERDRKELQALIRQQLEERQKLQKAAVFYREEHRFELYRLRREMAQYVSTAQEPLPPPKLETAKPVAPMAEQLAVIEARLSVLSGDITMLQASLENNLLSDEMRARIRLLIERAATALQIKALEKVAAAKKEEERAKEVAAKQAELADLLKRQAELQQQMQEQQRRFEANRQFYGLISDMSYSLNGLPPWVVKVMSPPPDKRLDEPAFIQTVQRRDNLALAVSILNSAANASDVSRRPPINPPTAAPNLRASVIEVQELFARAGLLPPVGGGTSARAPTLPTNTTIRFNAAKSGRSRT